MRKELAQIERIETYLLNKMDLGEREAFEQEMNSNPELTEHVNFQQNLMEGIRRFGVRQKIQRARKKVKLQKLIVKALIGVITAGIIAAAAYFFFVPGEHQIVDNEVLFEKPIAYPENDSLSTDANNYLDQEVFKIRTDRDNVIESEDGVVVFIPEGAFDTEAEEVDVVMQTAVKSEDVIMAGLSTQSNGADLETGGMFYIDAFDEGNRVGLVKDLTAEVPAGEEKNGMEVYDGVKMPDGSINWVNPKPVEKFLTPVNPEQLDFYPPGYEATLDNWGLYGKEFRDSLYFSFAFANSEWNSCERNPAPQRKLTPQERDFIYGDNRPIDKLMTQEEATILCENGMLEGYAGDPAIGEKLFNGNCTSCHFPNRHMTGPSLKGARERWINNSSEENFYAWIKNSQAVIKSGDEYANRLFGQWGNSVMTPQALTNEQIDHIFAYIETFPTIEPQRERPVFDTVDSALYPELIEGWDEIMDDSTAMEEMVGYDSTEVSGDAPCGVNPASVQAIWSHTFQRSIIGTREFEERMPWIHKSSKDEVLDVYLNNLDKPLHYSDSIVARMTYGEVRNKFLDFAARRDGRIERSIAVERLYEYYEKKRKANIEAITRTRNDYWNDQAAQDNQNREEAQKSEDRSSVNESDIVQKEFKANLKKVNEELGITSLTPVVNPSTYTITVSTLGWKNIDRKVQGITESRESAEFEFGEERAEITYNDWSATIANSDSYDRINLYNIPKDFASYIKLKANKGKYNYKLNADLEYQTLVLAWTENSIFFHQDKETQAGDHTIKLKPITLDEFKYNVAQNLNPIANMKSEMKFIEHGFKDQQRININKKKRRLKDRIEPVIFPCRSMEIGASHHGGSHSFGEGHGEEESGFTMDYESTPLKIVLSDVNDFFDVKTTLANRDHFDLELTTSFNSVTYDEVIETISAVFDFEVRERDDVTEFYIPSEEGSSGH